MNNQELTKNKKKKLLLRHDLLNEDQLEGGKKPNHRKLPLADRGMKVKEPSKGGQ